MNDMLIFVSNDFMIKYGKKILTSKFDMKDSGVVDVILGIKFCKTSNGLVLSQSYYVEKHSLYCFYRWQWHCRNTNKILNISKNKGMEIDELKYFWIIESLIYVMNHTRLDIMYLISKLSRFTSNPSMEHWKAIKKVLKYLRYTLDYRLYYTDYPTILKGYNDTNGYSTLKIQNPLVDMSSYSIEK